jgi:segregation and condensation protein B
MELKTVLEALLFASQKPLTPAELRDLLISAAAESEDQGARAFRKVSIGDIELALQTLVSEIESLDRTYRLVCVASAWQFVTRPEFGPWLRVLLGVKARPPRLSQPALETLAIIAYHQPCTRADIEDVRGVQVAKGSLDQLLEIGWVKMRGKRRDAPGRPTLYGTTEAFLAHFGLESVADLPGLADLRAAGLLDARLPPGFSVPAPADGEDEEFGDDEETGEFAQDFLDGDGEEAADA